MLTSTGKRACPEAAGRRAVFLSYLGSWITAAAAPARVALAIITILVATSHLIGLHDNLPPVNYAVRAAASPRLTLGNATAVDTELTNRRGLDGRSALSFAV